MSQSFSERLYDRLPALLQNVACSAVGYRESRIRFGAAFDKRLSWLLETERWSAAQIAAYQDEQLREMVRHAYDTVPFYRARMQGAGLAPEDIRTVADLPKLPILTKEEVRANHRAMVSSAADAKALVARHTSGTSGKALDFYTSRDGMAFQWAVWWRHRIRFGLEPGTWHVNFTGKPVVPPDRNSGPYWRWNWPVRQVLINMHHLTPEKAPEIAEFLGSRDIPLWTGYPSVVHAFVVAAQQAGAALKKKPKFVITGAENVLEFQRNDIAGYTGAMLTDQYGFSEGCGNASHCEHVRYHEDFEFGVIERVDIENNGGARRAKLVCTGFANPEFPFIRYEVGDMAEWDRDPLVCACGRQSFAFDRIVGRQDDYVVTPEGRRIMRFDYIFKETANVAEAQVVQEKLGEIVIRVVRRAEYNSADEQRLRGEVARWISPALVVSFEYVNEIERTQSGKFRAVVSRLKAGQPA